MNRDERNRLKRAVKAYDCSIRQADAIFEKSIDEMKDLESDKIDRLPQSLSSSMMAEGLNEAVEMLDSIMENAQTIIEQLDEILTTTDVASCYTSSSRKNTGNVTDKRDTSFHALLPSSLLLRLKEKSQRTGESMNELVCQAIQNNIEN